MLRCSNVLSLLIAVVLFSPVWGADPAPKGTQAASPQIPILMPDSPAVPGRTRPDGLLCVLGDDRLRVSGYPTRIVSTLDGMRLFVVTMTNVVDVVDAATVGILESFRAANARVIDVALAPDGKRLAAASLDGGVTVWDVSATPARRLQQYWPFEGTKKKDYWLNLSMSFGRLRFCVSADSGATVYEWTPDGLKTVIAHRAELGFKPGLISPDGSRLVLKTKNPTELQLLDLSASPAKVLDRLEREVTGELIFKDDDDFLAASTSSGPSATSLISIASDKLKVLRTLNDVTVDPFRSVQFLDQGRICVASHTTRGPAVFDCSKDQWEVLQSFPMKSAQGPFLLGGSADGSTLYATEDQILTSFTLAESKYVPASSTLRSNSTLGQVDNLAFLRDGTLAFSTNGGVHAVALGEPTRPRPLDPIRLKTPLKGTSYLIPHPTEREFVMIDISSPGSLVQVRDQGAGFEEIQRFSFGTGPEAWRESPWSAGYSPDGTTLAVGFWNQSIELYSNGSSGLNLRSRTPNAAAGHVCVLTFAPDGRSLACGDFGSNARVFDFDGELKTATILPKFGDAVRNAQFSADGSLLLLGSQNGEIRLTDLTEQPTARTTRQLLLQDEEAAKEGFESSGGVSSMQWVAGGKLLMTAKGRKGETRVVLWKMPDGKPLQTWTFTGWMHAAIDHDGFMVAVARSDGTVCVMQVSEEVQRWLNDSP